MSPQRWPARAAAALRVQEPAHALALTRIGVGITILGMLGAMLWTDSVSPVWLDPADGGLRDLAPRQWLARAVGAPTPAAVSGLMAAAAAGGLGLTLGLGGRLSAFVALQALLALFSLHPRTGGGHDRLISNALWLLVLAPSDQSLSLRCWLRSRSWVNPAPVAGWVRWLVIGQLVLMYAGTGMQKVGAEWFPWGDYAAVQRALLSPSWARWDLTAEVAAVAPLIQAATALSWMWEVGFAALPLLLWWRATRTRPGRLRAVANRLDLRAWMATFGLALHIGLLITMELGPFSLISMSLYPCLWSGEEWGRWLRRWSPTRPA
ncbi:MAG: HTTM domain-containing protein [Deltaproteobacteria bacterium]|nr:HTTM domain-containing protein [Deltaproteobacteria bacterium]